MPGTVISVYNAKGGVGKTSVSSNLAATLRSMGYMVLLVDADRQGDSSKALGFHKQKGMYTLADVILHQINSAVFGKARQVFVETAKVVTRFDFDLLLNNRAKYKHVERFVINYMRQQEPSPESYITALKLMEYMPYSLKDALELVKDEYDYIICDCAPQMGQLVKSAIIASDYVIVPLEAATFDIFGMQEMQVEIKDIRDEHDTNVQIMGFLLTQYDGRRTLDRETHQLLRNQLGDKFFRTVIRANQSIRNAQSLQEPVIIYSPKSIGAKDFLKLGKEVVERCQQRNKEKPCS